MPTRFESWPVQREAYDPTEHRAGRQLTFRLVDQEAALAQLVNAVRAAAPAKRMGPGPRP